MSRLFDLTRVTTERAILSRLLEDGKNLETEVEQIKTEKIFTQADQRQDELGLFRSLESRMVVLPDIRSLEDWQRKGLEVPSFLEAGPRQELRFNPHEVHAAIVTTGGLAPGLHCVIHSIVKRHHHTYGLSKGKTYGVYNGFKGMRDLKNNLIELRPKINEEWLHQGGG